MNFNDAIKVFIAKRGLERKGGHALGTGLYQDEKILRNFAVFMRNCPIEDVTDDHIIEWINLFKTMGYSDGTLKNKEQTLVSFYKLFKRKGLDVVDPLLIPKTRLYYQPKRVCTEENYLKLLDQVPLLDEVRSLDDAIIIRNRLMITLLWNCGMRRTELANLNISSINSERNLVTIKTAKSRGVRPVRTLPIDTFDQRAVEVLPVWLSVREKLIKETEVSDPEALFIAYKNQYGGEGKRLSAGSIEKTVVKISLKAGTEGKTNLHSLRHHYGHGLNKMRVNNSVISTSMGHSSIASSYVYTQPDDEELIEMLRKK